MGRWFCGSTLMIRYIFYKEKGANKMGRMNCKLECLVGHVCFYCHPVFDQTKDNPSRTDFCVKCGHRGEGVKRTLEKRDWGILHVVHNAQINGSPIESEG